MEGWTSENCGQVDTSRDLALMSMALLELIKAFGVGAWNTRTWHFCTELAVLVDIRIFLVNTTFSNYVSLDAAVVHGNTHERTCSLCKLQHGNSHKRTCCIV